MAKILKEKKRKKSASAPVFSSGKVVKTAGATYTVRADEDGALVDCRAKGKFRLKGIRTTNPVSVGDRVKFQWPEEGELGYIVEIEPRKNYIIRRASNLSKESHILAANIDQALLVATLKDPATPLVFIDRFLATCEAYDIPASIVLNKIDLLDDDDREIVDALRVLYEGLGYGFFETSASTGLGIENLREATRHKVSLLAGNSGVGKSSLINCIVPGLNLKTGKISDRHHTGMHTTTFSEIITLPYGGELIDIPGVKGFGTIDFAPSEVSHFFPEIFKFSKQCRFDDCRHVNVPGCAVEKAVEDHFISESRYNSYLNILEEASGEQGDGKYRKPF